MISMRCMKSAMIWSYGVGPAGAGIPASWVRCGVKSTIRGPSRGVPALRLTLVSVLSWALWRLVGAAAIPAPVIETGSTTRVDGDPPIERPLVRRVVDPVVVDVGEVA